MAKQQTRGERNCEWLEATLRVPSGRFAGQRLKLRPLQRKIIKGIYDTPTRTAILSMGRKNAKTSLAAMLVLLHLVGPEAVVSGEVYSAAQSKEQASILFKLAAKMVRMSPELSAYVAVADTVKTMRCAELGSEYSALSAEAPTKLGLSPTLVVHDELGQVEGPTFELYDALNTAQGAQVDPLEVIISTQAPSDGALLSQIIDDAAAGHDPKTKLWLYSAPLDADPWSQKTWAIANPLLGDVLDLEYVRDLADKARRMPAREAAFRNLVLNQRVSQTATLIAQETWSASAGEPDRDVLEDFEVVMGLDLSQKTDLTALVYCARDADRCWHTWAEFWVPEVGIRERSQRDRVPYELWAQQGWITTTPGASVNYDFVAHRLAELCTGLDVLAIAFDRWHIAELKKALERIGASLPLVEHGQGFRDMSPAVDALEDALLNGNMRHGGNPVLTWCALNAKAVADPSGNRKLDKKKSTGRIDGLVALAMALHAETVGADARPRERPASIYETGVI